MIISNDTIAFDSADVREMHRWIADGISFVQVRFRDLASPFTFEGRQGDLLWNQYINPPFQGVNQNFIPSLTNARFGPSFPTLPAQTDWRFTSIGSSGSVPQNPPSGLTHTQPVTPTAYFNSSGLPANGYV